MKANMNKKTTKALTLAATLIGLLTLLPMTGCECPTQDGFRCKFSNTP